MEVSERRRALFPRAEKQVSANAGVSYAGSNELAHLAQSPAGVKIGQNVWIGYDAIIETSRPDLVTIRDRATVQSAPPLSHISVNS